MWKCSTVEADIVVDQLIPIPVDDDFEGSDDFLDIKDRSVNKKNLQRCIDGYEVTFIAVVGL